MKENGKNFFCGHECYKFVEKYSLNEQCSLFSIHLAFVCV